MVAGLKLVQTVLIHQQTRDAFFKSNYGRKFYRYQ